MGGKKTFNRDEFYNLFYNEKLSYREISKKLNVPAATLSDYRWRNNLPKRGWSKHPRGMLGKKAWNKGQLCPKTTKEKNPNWKGGRYVEYNGYVMIRVDNHPFAYRNYIREHRFIMEQKLGRFLNKKEHVHHINGNKTDNRIENLVLFRTNSEHHKFHYPKGSTFGINSKKHHKSIGTKD